MTKRDEDSGSALSERHTDTQGEGTVAELLARWEELNRRMDADIEHPRLSIDGFIYLMRERDRAKDAYIKALVSVGAQDKALAKSPNDGGK